MHFKNRMSKNIPLEKEEMKEKGFMEKYLPFLAEIFVEKEDEMLPLAIKTGQFFMAIGMSDAVRLEINGSNISKDGSGKALVYELPGLIQGYKKRIKKVHIIGSIKANDLEITSMAEVELSKDGSYVSVSIENYGMVQIPKNLKAETFEKDASKLLSQGYLDKCEKTFIDLANRMAYSFKRIFSIDLMVSKIERTIIVPSKKDTKISKFYNRRFNDQESIYSPLFYRSAGVSPDYSYRGYADPFEIYWWMLIFDYTSGSSGGNENFIDSRGNEISSSDAAATVKDLDQNSLSQQLSENSSNFELGKYETFPESVEASRCEGITSAHEKDDEREKDKYSQSDNSAAYIAGDGGGSHSKSSGHNTNHDTSCTGGHDHSSCGGNNTSCGGSSCSSCGGGGCGGGGCGGG